LFGLTLFFTWLVITIDKDKKEQTNDNYIYMTFLLRIGLIKVKSVNYIAYFEEMTS